MTSETGGTMSPLNPPWPPGLRTTGLPPGLSKHLAVVTDPRRLYDCVAARRASGFQWLVRRFVIQIRHGCQEPRCLTPTCHSCQKRRKSPPYRRPTPLTARAMAYYLASQENPQSKLCPHRPAILPEELDVDGEEMVELIKATGVPKEKLLFYLEDGKATRLINPGEWTIEEEKDGEAMEAALTSKQFWSQYHGLMPKDRKSFTQMFYRTVSARYFEWTTLQKPMEVFRRALDDINGIGTAIDGDLDQHRPGLRRHLSSPSPMKNGDRHAIENTKAARDTAAEKKAFANGLQSNSVSSDKINTTEANNLDPTLRRRHTTPARTQTTLPKETKRIMNRNGLLVDTSKDKARETKPSVSVNGHDWTSKDVLPKVKAGVVSHQDDKAHRPKGHSNDHVVANGEPRHPIISDIQLSGQKRTQQKLNQEQSDPQEEKPPPKQETPPPEKAFDGLPLVKKLDAQIMRELSYLHLVSLREQPDIELLLAGPLRRVESPALGAALHLDNPSVAFVYRSLAYTLGNSDALLQSFHEDGWARGKNSPLPHLNPAKLDAAFRHPSMIDKSVTFDSLWMALEPLFNPPPRLCVRRARTSAKSAGSGKRKTSHAPQGNTTYYSDEQAAHIIMICTHALTAFVWTCSSHTMTFIRRSRSWGEVYSPHWPTEDSPKQNPWLPVLDALEYEPAIRLASRLVRAVAARRSHHEILKTVQPEGKGKAPMNSTLPSQPTKLPLIDILMRHLIEIERLQALRPPPSTKSTSPSSRRDKDDENPVSIPTVLIEWLRTIILKEWDLNPTLNRWSAVGASFELLSDLHAYRTQLNLDADYFELPLVLDAFEPDHLPFDFLNHNARNPNTVHILSFPSLFKRSALVAYFRAVNYASMIEAYGNVQFDSQLERRLDWCSPTLERAKTRGRLKKNQRFLLLEVRRESVLEDTFTQLWRRARPELLRPFKVRISSNEGEQGVDQGGVSQEFFRVALARALDPDVGMFTVDARTRMAWFRPGSLAPKHQFELVGLLCSIAVFNGITLPLTFPLALYKMLLGEPVETLDDIRDGWEDLARGFDDLLAWQDGDVEDVFVREYAFGVDLYGKHADIDMKAYGPGKKWTPPKDRVEANESSAAGSSSSKVSKAQSARESLVMVTNANREEFVRDYISWLVHRSVEDEYEAFARGFFACLDRKALSMLTPSTLRTLVEGHTTVSIAELRRFTRYDDGYHPNHPTIQAFWRVVSAWPAEKHNALLEFVTASDRIPVNGLQSVNFLISRHTSDSRLLPSAQTCFGRLLLPEYDSEEQLREKLGVALEFGLKGFGFQ